MLPKVSDKLALMNEVLQKVLTLSEDSFNDVLTSVLSLSPDEALQVIKPILMLRRDRQSLLIRLIKETQIQELKPLVFKNILFLFQASDIGLISPQEVMDSSFYAEIKEFLPENPQIQQILEINQDAIDRMSQNNWEEIRQWRLSHSTNNIEKVLVHDDIAALEQLASLPQFRFDDLVKVTIFKDYEDTVCQIPLISYAAMANSMRCFRFLLINGADVTKVAVSSTGKKLGMNTLYFAISSGNLEMIQLLIEKGLEIDQLAYTAVRHFENSIFDWFIDNYGVSLDTTFNNKSFLVAAAESNNIAIAIKLVEMNVDMQETPQKYLPVVEAIKHGFSELAEFLIVNGANINAKDLGRWTALHECSQQQNYRIAQLLIDNGANVNPKLFVALTTPLEISVKKGDFKMVQLLVDAGADVDAADNYRRPVLFYAIRHKFSDIALYLLEKRAKATSIDENGWSALHLAIYFKQFDIIDILLRGGADINCKSSNGTTPLHLCYAVRAGIEDKLIALGANESECDGEGRAPKDLLGTQSLVRKELI